MNQKTKTLTSLELVVGCHKLLSNDFKKYSQRWNFYTLIRYLNEPFPEQISNFKIVKQNQDHPLVKWFILEVLALLLPVSPSQKKNIFSAYFSSSEYDELQQKLFHIPLFILFQFKYLVNFYIFVLLIN